MKRTLSALVFVTALALPAAGQQRQSADAFKWSGHVPAGGWLRVRNLNGPITVTAASGNDVEVTAVKRWRRGDTAVVHFQTKKYGPGDESVVICALWGERSTCDEHGYESRADRGMRNLGRQFSLGKFE